MGRRSDHSRSELEELILSAGQQVMAQRGLAGFSAREVAKRIGYTVGTVMYVFGNSDGLIVAVNTRTFTLWTRWLEERLAQAEGSARIAALVRGYFDFARSNTNLWSAIFEHRIPDDMIVPEGLIAERARLTRLIVDEIAAVLPGLPAETIGRLARSLIATVHGHCGFALGGAFALMGIEDPVDLALDRIVEALAAARH